MNMFINNNEISLNNDKEIEFKECVISNMSMFIPLWAIYNPTKIEDDFFISNLMFDSCKKNDISSKTPKYIYSFMNINSNIKSYTLNNTFYIHRHSLIFVNIHEECAHKHIICLCKLKNEFVLLVRKDIKEKYILSLIKIYSKEYFVLPVDCIEDHIYVKLPLYKLMAKAINEFGENSFDHITENILTTINE